MTEPQIKFSNMTDLLKASPFDAEYNLNQTLTEDFFYAHLHVRSEELDSNLSRFHDFMYNDRQPNRVVFLKGYAGNGKTTFLHTFIRERPSYNHAYFDFQRLRFTTDPTGVYEDTEASPDEIKLLLNRRLREFENVDDTFRFVYANRKTLKNEDFISTRLANHLDTGSFSDDDVAAYIRDWMGMFTFKDTFTCFFVHLFRQRREEPKTICYFDNLDVASMQYLADRFLVYFQNAVSAASSMSQHDLFEDSALDFRADYRFVFALRDANEAILNAHLRDRLGFARTPFPLSFSGDTFASITSQRVRFVEEYFPSHDHVRDGKGRFSTMLNTILRDQYFQDVFLPLYNYNYRELASVLVDVIDEEGVTENDLKPISTRSSRGDVLYRLRGIVLFGLVKTLLRRDFLGDYRTVPSEVAGEGYCYIDRVMLTVLINCSHYRREADQKHESHPYGLLFLVKDLDIIYHDVDLILDSIARCYLSHRSNNIHLVTVLNTPIDGIERFVREHSLMIARARSGDGGLGTTWTSNDVASVEVRVNPAGFTCVRYILPHFEFYSNLVEKNTECLFQDLATVTRVRGKEQFSFEPKIDAVFAKVEQHVMSMKRFFETRYMAAGITPAVFSRSKYCFRHQQKSRLAKPVGHSHTVKIVTAHIDYIEHFRMRLLAIPGRDDAEKRRINEALVSRVRKYVDLLEHAPDAQAASVFAGQFRQALETIENAHYLDWTTSIALDPKSGYSDSD